MVLLMRGSGGNDNGGEPAQHYRTQWRWVSVSGAGHGRAAMAGAAALATMSSASSFDWEDVGEDKRAILAIFKGKLIVL
jgi:hypothetical protein